MFLNELLSYLINNSLSQVKFMSTDHIYE